MAWPQEAKITFCSENYNTWEFFRFAWQSFLISEWDSGFPIFILRSWKVPKFGMAVILTTFKSGRDPTEVDPNVATFVWNASLLSDLTDLASTNGTDLCWLSADFKCLFCKHDDVTRSPLTHVISNPKAKYRVLYYIVTMRVAKDANSDPDILVNNGDTSSTCAARCCVL